MVFDKIDIPIHTLAHHNKSTANTTEIATAPTTKDLQRSCKQFVVGVVVISMVFAGLLGTLDAAGGLPREEGDW